MLAVVKKPHTKKTLFELKGLVPNWLVTRLRKEYGKNLLLEKEDEEYVNIENTNWFKEMNKKMRPGDFVRIYRENFGMTQEELGRKLGNFSRQNISAIEKGLRGISKTVAKKLSHIFDVPIERFL